MKNFIDHLKYKYGFDWSLLSHLITLLYNEQYDVFIIKGFNKKILGEYPFRIYQNSSLNTINQIIYDSQECTENDELLFIVDMVTKNILGFAIINVSPSFIFIKDIATISKSKELGQQDREKSLFYIGTILITLCELYSYLRNTVFILLQSESRAIGFYEKLGYSCLSEDVFFSNEIRSIEPIKKKFHTYQIDI
jgi:hypothetical protein